MLYEITYHRLNSDEKLRRKRLLLVGIVGVATSGPAWIFIGDDVGISVKRLIAVGCSASLQFFALSVFSLVALLGSQAIENSWGIGRSLAKLHFFGMLGFLFGLAGMFLTPVESDLDLFDWILFLGIGVLCVLGWISYLKKSLKEGMS